MRTALIGGLLGVFCLLGGGCNKYEDKAVETVRQNRADLQTCVDAAFGRNAALKGELELGFEVAPDGRVTRFAVLKNDTGDSLLGDCIQTKAPNWAFPAPASGKVEQFKYKMNVKK